MGRQYGSGSRYTSAAALDGSGSGSVSGVDRLLLWDGFGSPRLWSGTTLILERFPFQVRFEFWSGFESRAAPAVSAVSWRPVAAARQGPTSTLLRTAQAQAPRNRTSTSRRTLGQA